MNARWWMVVLALGLAGVAARADEPAAPLDPALPYQAERLDPVTYDVDLSIIVTPPYKTERLRVWVPIPPTDAAQEVGPSRFSTFPLDVAPEQASEPEFGNRFAYFEFVKPQGAQIVRHQFQVRVWELRWRLDPARVERVAAWPSAFEPYLRGESQAVVVDQRFRDALARIVPEPRGTFDDLGQVFRWVQANFDYDHGRASLRASAEHALETRAGHCSDYHGFCASLGRALGYPTRVTYGINPYPKNSPSHCKLEAFLPPYGWVSFDVSETQKLVELLRRDSALDPARRAALIEAAERRFLSGFRDNTWFLQTRGTDYQLAPPASRRVPVVRTAYVEADGVPLPDPDPADPSQRAFSWMTAHAYRADRAVESPFVGAASLERELKRP